MAKNKEGGICGKALGHDNYNPVQGINKELEEKQEEGEVYVGQTVTFMLIYLPLGAAHTHGAYDLCRQLSHL